MSGVPISGLLIGYKLHFNSHVGAGPKRSQFSPYSWHFTSFQSTKFTESSLKPCKVGSVKHHFFLCEGNLYSQVTLED